MNVEISIKEENGVIKLKITSPDKPVVIETEEAKEEVVTETKLAAMNREYERLKKAASRAKKRFEKYFVPNVPETVPGDSRGQGQAVTTYNNTNTINNNHDSDHDFIPFAKLPELHQKILTAWNNLPLPEKLKGLYPDVAQKLHTLLKEYGEAAVQKAIHMVTESPFLLGKITNTRGWKHIYFGWLLNPGNLKKILENKYRDRNQSYECVTYPEYIPWDNVDSLYLDPEQMAAGVVTLTDHARSSLSNAAKLLGLTKNHAA